MLYEFDGPGSTTLEIELGRGEPPDRGIDCRLVLASGHVETIELDRRHERLLLNLVTYLIEDRAAGVGERLLGFRAPIDIARDTAKVWFPIQLDTIAEYSKQIRRRHRRAVARARDHDPDLVAPKIIETVAGKGVRLVSSRVRIIDHSQPS